VYQPPAVGSNNTVVVRAFYPWPLFVTGLGLQHCEYRSRQHQQQQAFVRDGRVSPPMTVKFMKPLALPRLLVALHLSTMRLVRDRRGNAAVEFAVIVPLMLVMFFGTIEFSSGVAVDRKVSLVTQELADLTSRYAYVFDADFTNFTTIANAMLTPYSATPLKATISEVYIDPATGGARVQWEPGIRASRTWLGRRRAGRSDCQRFGDESDISESVFDFHRSQLSLHAGSRLCDGESGRHSE
jgi:Flp pilus assembly pilin Flp